MDGTSSDSCTIEITEISLAVIHHKRYSRKPNGLQEKEQALGIWIRRARDMHRNKN